MKRTHEKIIQAETEDGQALGEAMVQVIEEQLKQNDPPIVRKTLKRLIRNGESRANAIRYICSALSQELFMIMKHHEPYKAERYERALKALPKMPWDDENGEI